MAGHRGTLWGDRGTPQVVGTQVVGTRGCAAARGGRRRPARVEGRSAGVRRRPGARDGGWRRGTAGGRRGTAGGRRGAVSGGAGREVWGAGRRFAARDGGVDGGGRMLRRERMMEEASGWHLWVAPDCMMGGWVGIAAGSGQNALECDAGTKAP